MISDIAPQLSVLVAQDVTNSEELLFVSSARCRKGTGSVCWSAKLESAMESLANRGFATLVIKMRKKERR